MATLELSRDRGKAKRQLGIPIKKNFSWIMHAYRKDTMYSPQVWAIYDGVVHGLVGVLVLYPIYKKQINRYFSVLFLLASLVDLDHFIIAQSFSLSDAIRLPLRPVSHSITFAILLAVVGFFLTRDRIVGWTLFAAVTSHVIRDASGGNTPLFWPFEIYHIPSWLYYGAEIVLLHISFQISRIQGNDK
jgi:hypothetical protein